MAVQALKNYFNQLDRRQQQANNIVFITFWSQFASYAFNTILILFLTRPLFQNGLGYTEAKAYAFIGVTQATGYLMPLLGGHMADSIIGVRRSILLGSIMLASAYLLVLISGYTVQGYGDFFFIAAYAFIPVTNSLLMGTASSMVSHIYSDDSIKAKSAMTYYYLAINAGALLATFIAPILLDSKYGPLSVITIAFIGKSIAALNFSKRYSVYEDVLWGKDQSSFSVKNKYQLLTYVAVIYSLTLFAYSHIHLAIFFITAGCLGGLLWFFAKTLALTGHARKKQLLALLLIVEAIIFFVIYNQMNSTLIMFAKNNSNNLFLGIPVSPAHYQLINPLLILLIGVQLPRFYQKVPGFTIPYQFAAGTFLAGLSLLLMAFACHHAVNGYVNGNYIALTYTLITLGELWVSAIGLSMIGLYCDKSNIAFAMGVWYIACSLSNAISGRLAAFVALPDSIQSAIDSLPYYKHYYFNLGLFGILCCVLMWILSYHLHQKFNQQGIKLA